MEFITNKTPKFIYVLAVIVVIFTIFAIAHANYEMFLRVDPIKFIGQKTINLSQSETVLLYKSYSTYEKVKSLIMSLGYSLSTMLIIVYYRTWFVKALFVIIDGLIVYIYLGFNYDFWWRYGSVIYGIYTALIIAFVGFMASKFINELQKEPEPIKQAEIEPILTNSNNNELITKVSKLLHTIENANNLRDINKRISVRRQFLQRKGIEFETDAEHNDLIEERKKYL